MIEWLRERSLPTRVLVYAVAAILAFAAAAGVGATAALMLQGDLSLPMREEPQPAGEQGNTPQRQGAANDRSQQKEAGIGQKEDATQQDEAEYTSKVGDIQNEAVEASLESNGKLVRYDALTADDIKDMEANYATLGDYRDRVEALDPPEKYEGQYEVFVLAINELYAATKLAYRLAADPVSATADDFDAYDRHIDEATSHLRRSNEILGRDYKTTEAAQDVILG
jgi:hypothetical protein